MLLLRRMLPMKKAMLVLMMVTILISLACEPVQNSNTRVSNSRNSNDRSGLSEDDIVIRVDDESPERCRDKPNDEKMFDIVINLADVGGCKITDLNGDDISPDAEVAISYSAKQKVRWCIENKCNIPVQVLIDNFSKLENASEKNPFGNRNDQDNTFLTGVIRYTKAKHLVSKLPHKDSNNETYKYYIRLFDLNGALLDSVDPRVVISDAH
jgi:hypothetical protein